MLRIEAIGRLPLVDNIIKLCILLFRHLTMLGGVAGGRYPLTRSLEVCDSTMRLRIYFGGEESWRFTPPSADNPHGVRHRRIAHVRIHILERDSPEEQNNITLSIG